jgi:RNA polymerase sigma-70 factor (ECF subfamily)
VLTASTDPPGCALGTDDATLVARVAGGDQHALAELYDRHGSRAYTLARRVCVDTRLAEDAVQEAFLAFWTNPSRYDPARGKFRSWLLTIVHHKSVDLVRAQHRQFRIRLGVTEDELSLIPPSPSADQSVLLEAEADVVRAALIHLPVAQRRTLELAFYGGYTQLEIATILAIPIGTVKSRTFTALATLRELLRHHRP